MINMRLIIATTNEGKLREYRELLSGIDAELDGLHAFDGLNEPAETGATFEENAGIKAREYAQQTGEWVLADDSGLEIAALGGAPGVHSARFGGERSSYAQKIAMILDRMRGSPDRSARFVCVIAVARPNGTIAATALGECRGEIAERPRGANGFGYDPVFVPLGHRRTFGEMTDEEKSALSHRGRAAERIIRKMLDFIGV